MLELRLQLCDLAVGFVETPLELSARGVAPHADAFGWIGRSPVQPADFLDG
jgi:hypothetical protein